MFIHNTDIKLPNNAIELKPGRRYVNSDGIKYLHINTLLKSQKTNTISANSVDWQSMLGSNKKTNRAANKIANRIAAIREMTFDFLNNKEVDFDSYQPEYVGYFNQLRMKLNKVDNIKQQGTILVSDDFQAIGEVDCVADYKGVPSIIKFETASTTPNNRKSFDMQFKLCAFNALCWFEMADDPIEQLVILVITERGIVPIEYVEPLDAWVKPLLQNIKEYYK